MNDVIDFLSNSKNVMTIRLLNRYPYKVTPRNLDSVTETTARLIDLGEGREVAHE